MFKFFFIHKILVHPKKSGKNPKKSKKIRKKSEKSEKKSNKYKDFPKDLKSVHPKFGSEPPLDFKYPADRVSH